MRGGARPSFAIMVLARLALTVIKANYIHDRSGIVGGDEVEPHSIPWQVALTVRGSKAGFIFVQHLRGFKASFAIWRFAFYPRLDKCHRLSQIFPVAFRRF